MYIQTLNTNAYYAELGRLGINPPTNNGIRREQLFRFTLTGKIIKADNIAHTISADIDNIQIKSSRATVCDNGLSFNDYIAIDKAERFAYVRDDEKTAVIMSRQEWLTFIEKFAINDMSDRNKYRLPRETNEIKKYFFKLYH